MSGGDGKGHNSGAHSTGGVNGSSGKGGYDGHNLGGHTTNNCNGTSTTTITVGQSLITTVAPSSSSELTGVNVQ